MFYPPPPSPLAKAAVRSKAVVLLLLIYCLMYFPLFVGALCLSLICYALLYVHSSFAIILKRKRKLVALFLLSFRCLITVIVLWFFLTMPWAGLQCVIVVLTYFLIGQIIFIWNLLSANWNLPGKIGITMLLKHTLHTLLQTHGHAILMLYMTTFKNLLPFNLKVLHTVVVFIVF